LKTDPWSTPFDGGLEAAAKVLAEKVSEDPRMVDAWERFPDRYLILVGIERRVSVEDGKLTIHVAFATEEPELVAA
jgi:hypothetical protein